MYPVVAAAPTNAPRVKAPRPLPRTAWTAAETAVLTTPLVCPEQQKIAVQRVKVLLEYKATCIKSPPLRGLCKHAWCARLAEHRLESAVPKDVSDRDTVGPWPCHCLQSPARSLCSALAIPSLRLCLIYLGFGHDWTLLASDPLSAAPPCSLSHFLTTFLSSTYNTGFASPLPSWTHITAPGPGFHPQPTISWQHWPVLTSLY